MSSSPHSANLFLLIGNILRGVLQFGNLRGGSVHLSAIRFYESFGITRQLFVPVRGLLAVLAVLPQDALLSPFEDLGIVSVARRTAGLETRSSREQAAGRAAGEGEAAGDRAEGRHRAQV